MRKITLFIFVLLPLLTSCQFALRPLLLFRQHQSIPPQPVTATPAPIFKSIIPQLQNEIPQGKLVRLPSYFDLINQQGEKIPVYPKIIYHNSNELRIDMVVDESNIPDKECKIRQENHCIFAVIYISYYINDGAIIGFGRLENVPLIEGIVGRYSQDKSKKPYWDAIYWEQDNSLFAINLMGSGKQKAIDIAKSMASTLPLRSTK